MFGVIFTNGTSFNGWTIGWLVKEDAMKSFFVSASFLSFLFLPAVTRAEAVDWTACKPEVSANCTEQVGDKDKHDCLGKLDAAKLSKECLVHFKGLCKQFGKRCKPRHHHRHVGKGKR